MENNTTETIKKRSLIRRVAPWIALSLLILLLFRRIDFADVWLKMQGLNYFPLIGLSVVFVLGVLLIDALSQWLAFGWFNCKVFLGEMVKGRGAMMLGASVAYILGQAGMAWYVRRRKSVPLSEATATVIYLFFAEVYGMMLVSLLGVILLWPDVPVERILSNLFGSGEESFLPSGLEHISIILFFALIWISFIVVHLIFKLELKSSLLAKVKGNLLFKVFREITPSRAGALLLVKGLLALHQMLMTIAIFAACGVDIPWREVLAFMPISILISAIPITPLRVGTTQWGWVIFFGHVADPALLVGFSFVWQVILNIVRFLIGAAFLPWVKKDLF